MSHRFRFPLLLLGLVFLGTTLCPGAITNYTSRGKTDFDNALLLLNPYGTWSKIDGAWAYTPLDHGTPYTSGRWIYTEYGWCWKGNRPHSWVTEHYGYWKRDTNKVWSWYPGPYWLPSIVEIRQTPTHIGWRSGMVNREGSFVEPPDIRYTKNDEWTFVTLAQFANPITPDVPAKPDQVANLLMDSIECRHTYTTYREIDRPGPHPADLVAFSKDGGMLAPVTLEDQAAAQAAAPKPTAPILITSTNAPSGRPVTGTNAPALIGAEPEIPHDDRKVKYWITMSLPTFWTKPPPDAKATEVYLYRPDFFQDDDGIARRITLWFDPKSRATLKDILGGSLPGSSPGKPATASSSASATPAVPVKPHTTFASPFEETYKPAKNGNTSGSSSKNPVPSGRANPEPIPSPLTNAAPAKPAQR